VDNENELHSATSDQTTSAKGIDTLVKKSVQPGSSNNDHPERSVEPKNDVTQNTSPAESNENGTNSYINFGETPRRGINTVVNEELGKDPNVEYESLSPTETVTGESPSTQPLLESAPASNTKVPTTGKKPNAGSKAGAPELKLVAAVAVIIAIVSAIELIIGGLYINNCPVNPYIPIYLIVAGILGLLLPAFLLGLVSFRCF
jgi:hypothetical protein